LPEALFHLRDIVLTNQEVLSAALDLSPRRLDDLREKLASRELERTSTPPNELYKLLRSLWRRASAQPHANSQENWH